MTIAKPKPPCWPVCCTVTPLMTTSDTVSAISPTPRPFKICMSCTFTCEVPEMLTTADFSESTGPDFLQLVSVS